jgi:hypothetical protein
MAEKMGLVETSDPQRLTLLGSFVQSFDQGQAGTDSPG